MTRVIHPNSLKNLSKKGKTNNPNGRTRIRMSMEDVLKIINKEEIKEFLEKLKEKARAGEDESLKFLLSRVLPAVPRSPSVASDFNLVGTTIEKVHQLLKDGPGKLTVEEMKMYESLIAREYDLTVAAQMSEDIKAIKEALNLK